MPVPVLGIDNLKLALKFSADFSDQIAQTKKFSVLAAFGFVDDLIALGGVITAWKNIVAEFKDLDPAERAALNAYAKDVLKIPAEKVKDFIADALDWALLTFAMVERARTLKK